MAFFSKLFEKVGGENNGMLPETPLQVSQSNKVKQNLPIDILHDFLKQDFEERGFIDGQKNPDVSNRILIKRDWEINVREVVTEYKRRINALDTQITIQNSARNLFQIAKCEQLKTLYYDHLERVAKLDEDFKAEKPEISGVLISYDNGFSRGVNFIASQIV